MFAVPASLLPRQTGDPSPPDPTREVFLAFGRVFAGQLKPKQKLHVLSAAYSPASPEKHRQEVQVLTLLYPSLTLKFFQLRPDLSSSPFWKHKLLCSVKIL